MSGMKRYSRRATDYDMLLAENKRLLAALVGLRGGCVGEPCWCEMSIGNPMYREHTESCKAATAALENTQ